MYKIENIKTDKLLHFEGNPRFDPNIESGLLESIKKRGIRVPLLVSQNHNGKYDVIDGERRRACAIVLNIPTVPCIIEEMDEETKWIEAFNLNEERDSFSPMERANHFYRLKTKFVLSDKILATQSVARYKDRMIAYLIALKKLPDEIQNLVHDRALGVMPAYELSRLAFDVSFPHTGNLPPKEWVAKEKGRVWDFVESDDIQKFPEWKDKCKELQIELATRYRDKDIEKLGDQTLLEALKEKLEEEKAKELERRELEGKKRKELEEKVDKAENELLPVFEDHNKKMDEIIKKLEFDDLEEFKLDLTELPDDMREFARDFQKKINEKQPDEKRMRLIKGARNTTVSFREKFQKKDPTIFELGKEVEKEAVCDNCGHEVDEKTLDEFILTIDVKVQELDEIQTFITENRNKVAKNLGNLSGSVNNLNDLRDELKDLDTVGEGDN